jgi:hypothetical protein
LFDDELLDADLEEHIVAHHPGPAPPDEEPS